MNIQIAPRKIVDDAMVVWTQLLPEVDLAMNPRIGILFKSKSIDVVYAMDILGQSSLNEGKKIINEIYRVLKPGGEVYIIENDFEFINRALVSGDISVKDFNKNLLRETYYDQLLLVELLNNSGFPAKEQRTWTGKGIKIKVKQHQLIISGKKPQ